MKHPYLSILTLSLLVGMVACKKDTTETKCDSNLAYSSSIKSIIDNNCTTSGCHGSKSPLGDFTSYAGLKSVLTNGDFKRVVITQKSMPKGSTLSESDFTKIECWVNNGFKE